MRVHYAKRQQNTDITAIPSVSGISGYKTAANPSDSQLVVGTNTGSVPSGTDSPDFAPGSSIVITSTSTTSLSPSQTSTVSPDLSGAKSVISLSTVIAVCIGAFVGAGILICLSILFYRRSSRRPPPRRSRQPQALALSHGVNPATPWTKFDDGEDKWEGRNEMSEKTGPTNIVLPPVSQRTTSPHSAGKTLAGDDHFGSDYDIASQSVPFSHYHPKLPEQTALEPPRPVGVDDHSRESIEGSTVGTFLSLGTVHIESGKMSPTFNVAKTTPAATSSKLHQWESAEVIDPDAHAQEVEIHHDPFSDKSTPTHYSPTETIGDRRSFHNPFFNAHPGVHSRRPSASRKQSTMSLSSDPFNKDDVTMAMPKPSFISHTVNHSSSSDGSVGNEKAIQNLIAALDLSQEVIDERMRVASMHPSEASRYSTVMDSPVGYAIPIPETEEIGFFVQ
ncbi:hypothetical protein BJ322DRAFT_406721 [Thelephora terrestris]|uniref:Uncharacterized protein n=1 Tax=Thelephora terrestris TaxID=56493 RepID=A0A9P6HP02_9AGAM|nr:hypothetical protein BJ322DRAFT_406721 [Thelephora terrestris]